MRSVVSLCSRSERSRLLLRLPGKPLSPGRENRQLAKLPRPQTGMRGRQKEDPLHPGRATSTIRRGTIRPAGKWTQGAIENPRQPGIGAPGRPVRRQTINPGPAAQLKTVPTVPGRRRGPGSVVMSARGSARAGKTAPGEPIARAGKTAPGMIAPHDKPLPPGPEQVTLARTRGGPTNRFLTAGVRRATGVP